MTHARRRRITAVIIVLVTSLIYLGYVSHIHHFEQVSAPIIKYTGSQKAVDILPLLEIKQKDPFAGYQREQFGEGWLEIGSCDTRNLILARDLVMVKTGSDGCSVAGGTLHDPYTGKDIAFKRGNETSDDVQIDHIVALANAWQTGAQQLSSNRRIEFANDSLNLLAVEGQANQDKGSADAASWLPPNESFQCRYVARQIAVKYKYNLWVTKLEASAFSRVLALCPDQILPIVSEEKI